MPNNLKKKYKFDISFYILFLFFLIFFIKFSTINANANTYKVTDLEISKTYDNNFNKDAVIDMAIKKATNLSLISKQTNYTLTGFIESYNNIVNKITNNYKNN